MKVLFVVRLFSGLERSLLNRRWDPTGVPAITKIIEALDRSDINLRLVFTCKDYELTWKQQKYIQCRIKGLNAVIDVLAGKKKSPGHLGILAGFLREIRQTLRIACIYHAFRPDVLYFDRINIIPAACMACFFKTPVVIRLMGVGTPFLQNLQRPKKPSHALMRWAFRSPFSYVICTEDGSGAATWLNRVISRRVPHLLLINGVDPIQGSALEDQRLEGIPEGKTIILFVGRLEKLKGCEEFLLGFFKALEKERNHLHALIVGNGSLAGILCKSVQAHRASHKVTFIHDLPHDQIMHVYRHADIYVSLNRGGNLSNANLEAMRAGCCMIIPASQPSRGIDVTTDRFISSNAAVRIPSADDTDSLAEAILRLHRDPEERLKRGRATERAAKEFIPTWEERINREIEILCSLTSSKN